MIEDWGIRGWILAMGGAQCAMFPLQFSTSWTFHAIGKLLRFPTIPMFMGIGALFAVAGAFANNFTAAYAHGMTSTIFVAIGILDFVMAFFAKPNFSESVEHHGEVMAISLFMIFFHGTATVGAYAAAAQSKGLTLEQALARLRLPRSKAKPRRL